MSDEPALLRVVGDRGLHSALELTDDDVVGRCVLLVD